MQETIIGRKSELKILQKAILSPKAGLIAVTGRRRIGKTFLITQAYQEHIVFEMIGTQNGLLQNQLENFAEAFRLLRDYLKNKTTEQKKVLFFDELPWLSGQKMGRFQNTTKTKKHSNWVLIGSFGLAQNQYSSGLVSNSLILDDLFL